MRGCLILCKIHSIIGKTEISKGAVHTHPRGAHHTCGYVKFPSKRATSYLPVSNVGGVGQRQRRGARAVVSNAIDKAVEVMLRIIEVIVEESLLVFQFQVTWVDHDDIIHCRDGVEVVTEALLVRRGYSGAVHLQTYNMAVPRGEGRARQ